MAASDRDPRPGGVTRRRDAGGQPGGAGAGPLNPGAGPGTRVPGQGPGCRRGGPIARVWNGSVRTGPLDSFRADCRGRGSGCSMTGPMTSTDQEALGQPDPAMGLTSGWAARHRNPGFVNLLATPRDRIAGLFGPLARGRVRPGECGAPKCSPCSRSPRRAERPRGDPAATVGRRANRRSAWRRRTGVPVDPADVARVSAGRAAVRTVRSVRPVVRDPSARARAEGCSRSAESGQNTPVRRPEDATGSTRPSMRLTCSDACVLRW